MNLGVVGQAAGLFAVTNVDDLLILALFFAQGAGRRSAAARVVAGQYLGFLAILAAPAARRRQLQGLKSGPCMPGEPALRVS
ncbi:hypothetical protein AB0C28_32855 [Nonomuraea sp. NPDC048892]|uniref:hypothetical protein n=1 Tax=Nonomuraea sp. NPDC048892 TaxID=3154624 RepID=UPI0033FE0CA3